MPREAPRDLTIQPRFERGFLNKWGPPLAAWIVVKSLTFSLAWSVGLAPWEPGTWIRWDSEHYLSIADSGYELYPCQPGPRWQSDDWCGNCGWFPGYPFLIRSIAVWGVAPQSAAIAVSTLAHFSILWLLWNCLLDSKSCFSNWLILAAASLFPGNIYYQAVFPISLVVALMLGCLINVARGRLIVGGLCGAFAAYTYTTGVLLAPPICLWILGRYRREGMRVAIRHASVVFALIFSGLLAVFLTYQLSVGEWDAIFKVQEKYGHHLQNPLGTLWSSARTAFRADLGLRERIPALQTVLVALFVAQLTWAETRAWSRQPRTEIWGLPSLYCLVMILFWLFPLAMGSGVSLYRSEALLFPGLAVANRLSLGQLLLLTTASFTLAAPMAILFFAGVLI